MLDLTDQATPTPITLDHDRHGVWRYRNAFPYIADENVTSLGEITTPLVGGRKGTGIQYKLDYLFPTGSFKDRGSTVLTSWLKEIGVTQAVEDSSGNAGASMSAYFAAAGIEGTVYVPASTSLAKTHQIQCYGARLVPVSGSRADVAQAAQTSTLNAYYASHLWSPLFLAGTQTFAFEIWEQLGHRLPDNVVVPVGGGTLLLGAYLGFNTLHRTGVTDRLPAIWGVQSEAYAPLARAFMLGLDSADKIDFQIRDSAAEGVRIHKPPRHVQILRAVRETGGGLVTVTESEIRHTWSSLARRGLLVEPTAAVAPAAAEIMLEKGVITGAADTVVALTGTGLKGTKGMVKNDIIAS